MYSGNRWHWVFSWRTNRAIGGAEWPDIDYIPEFKKGRIISAAYDSNSAIITIEEVDQKSYDDYLEDIKKSFTDETYNMQTEDFLAFEGMNDKGEKVALQYYINDKTLTIVGNRESQWKLSKPETAY